MLAIAFPSIDPVAFEIGPLQIRWYALAYIVSLVLGWRYALYLAGRSLIDLVDVTGKLGRPGGAAPGAEGRNVDHVCLGVRPYDEAALRAHLASHGVSVQESGSRYGAEGEGHAIYIRDPEGNTVELKGSN